MTRKRRFGDDTPLGQWIRGHEELDSTQAHLNVTDSDWMFQKFMTPVDSKGTREIQLAMFVEAKTRGGRPKEQQQEILFYHHQLLCTSGKCRKVKRIKRTPIALWHFGVFFLSMPGERPDEYSRVEWGRFEDGGNICWTEGPSDSLHRILKFDIRPDTLCNIELRRHHKTGEIAIVEETPLGFEVEKLVALRS